MLSQWVKPGRMGLTASVMMCLALATGLATAQELSGAETELLERIAQEPVESFIPPATEAMTELGCTVDMDDDSAFNEAIASKVAMQMGHDDPLSAEAVEAIGFATSRAGLAMVGLGAVSIDNTENTATLIECEAKQ